MSLSLAHTFILLFGRSLICFFIHTRRKINLKMANVLFNVFSEILINIY